MEASSHGSGSRWLEHGSGTRFTPFPPGVAKKKHVATCPTAGFLVILLEDMLDCQTLSRLAEQKPLRHSTGVCAASLGSASEWAPGVELGCPSQGVGGGGSKTIQNGSLPEIITVIMEVEHMPCAP